MKGIRFSRHARRRMKLYGIPEDTVIVIVQGCDAGAGRHEVVSDVQGSVLPLKVVFEVRPEPESLVITASPLRRAKR